MKAYPNPKTDPASIRELYIRRDLALVIWADDVLGVMPHDLRGQPCLSGQDKAYNPLVEKTPLARLVNTPRKIDSGGHKIVHNHLRDPLIMGICGQNM
jgi:hypothetical protein